MTKGWPGNKTKPTNKTKNAAPRKQTRRRTTNKNWLSLKRWNGETISAQLNSGLVCTLRPQEETRQIRIIRLYPYAYRQLHVSPATRGIGVVFDTLPLRKSVMCWCLCCSAVNYVNGHSLSAWVDLQHLDQNPVRESSTHPSPPLACYLTFPPRVLADAAVPPQFRCWITPASLPTWPLLVSNVAPPLGRVLVPRAI